MCQLMTMYKNTPPKQLSSCSSASLLLYSNREFILVRTPSSSMTAKITVSTHSQRSLRKRSNKAWELAAAGACRSVRLRNLRKERAPNTSTNIVKKGVSYVFCICAVRTSSTHTSVPVVLKL